MCKLLLVQFDVLKVDFIVNPDLALLARNVVSDLGSKNAVLHHQHLQFPNVVDEELLEAIWAYMLGFAGSTITNVWHKILALEAPAYSVVNTLRLTPVGL